MKKPGLLLLLSLSVLGAVAAAWLGIAHSRRRQAEEAPLSDRDVLWEENPQIRRWALEAQLAITGWEWVEQLGQEIAVFETVFWEPRDTTSLREWLTGPAALEDKTVLEIGTGSGLLALCCLHAGAQRVVATDVNPSALCNTFYNAHNLCLNKGLELRRVPLDDAGAFSVIEGAEKFDYVVSNPPWEDDVPEAIDDYAYYDPGFQLLRSLLEGLEDHLEPGGKALLAYGSREAIQTVLRVAPEYGLEVRVLDDRDPSHLPPTFLPGMMLEVVPVEVTGGRPELPWDEGVQ